MRRRLDAELVRRGLARSRADAAAAIEAGRVVVGGAPAPRAARLVAPGEPISVRAEAPRFVSRGGHKLRAALQHFDVDPSGQGCLDVGASTGGFTDCLLQGGAAHVVAVDVGRGQLDWTLRNDSRVTVLEQTDVRDLDPVRVGPVGVVVMDLAFISARRVLEHLAGFVGPDTDLLVLVKPQFEAGRRRVGKGGVVRDAPVHLDVLRTVVAASGPVGLVPLGAMPSPLRGADGNVEFMLHLRTRGEPLSDGDLRNCVDKAHRAP